MCGIIGFSGTENCVPLLLEGLKTLSYRGYDSAGIATHTADGICIVCVDVHFKSELLMDANLDIEPTGTLGAGEGININVIAVLDIEFFCVIGTHVDVSVCDDTALVKSQGALRTYDCDRRGACKRSGLTNGGLYLKNVGIRHGYLNLIF